MTTHSVHFPPSGAWAGEQGCSQWEADPSPAGETAIRGSVRHGLIEHWLKATLANPEKQPPAFNYPSTILVDGKPIQVLNEDMDVVMPAVDWVSQQPAVLNNGKYGYRVWVEHQVNYGKALGIENISDTYGTLDLGLHEPNRLKVIDWKFGERLIVPPTPQLKMYALGLGAELDFGGASRQVRQLELGIYQPANPKTYIFNLCSIDDLVGWKNEIQNWVKNRHTTFNPSDYNCRWCHKRGECKAREQWATDAISKAFGPVTTQQQKPTMNEQIERYKKDEQTKKYMKDENQQPHTGKLVNNLIQTNPAPLAPSEVISDIADTRMAVDPTELSEQDLARYLDVADIGIAFFMSVKETALERAKQGGSIPHWKVVAGRRSRAWRDTDETIFQLRKFNKLKKADVFEEKLRSIAELEKKVAATLGPRQQKVFADLWTWKDGKPVLAPEDDPRQALTRAEFEPIEQPQPQQQEETKTEEPQQLQQPKMPVWY